MWIVNSVAPYILASWMVEESLGGEGEGEEAGRVWRE